MPASQCSGVQIHVEDPGHYDHAAFKAVACAGAGLQGDPPPPSGLRAVAGLRLRIRIPERLAIDLINGSPLLREWVDDPAATPADLDALTLPDEAAWREARRPFLIY